jgi:hypothetical protein
MEKLNSKTVKLVDVSAWDRLVQETYGKPYDFQQQDGCRERGIFHLTVPDTDEDYMHETIPEVVNGDEMGVKFKIWLDRDPKKPIPGQKRDYELYLFWERNFYPSPEMVANDLHAKGILEAGDYVIEVS